MLQIWLKRSNKKLWVCKFLYCTNMVRVWMEPSTINHQPLGIWWQTDDAGNRILDLKPVPIHYTHWANTEFHNRNNYLSFLWYKISKARLWASCWGSWIHSWSSQHNLKIHLNIILSPRPSHVVSLSSSPISCYPNKMLKFYGHIVSKVDSRWARRIMHWSMEGR
jgi:hypothetical protein